MIEKTVVSYGYIPETKVMMTKGNGTNGHEAILSFSQFEENFLNKQSNIKSSAKKNARRRIEKSRNALRGSDAESDTSDGFTVNSGGSGRSGDWGPPKVRQKPKYSRKRYEQRASFTDSGISLTKTDSGDLSELSYQCDKEKFFIHKRPCDYSDNSHERYSRFSKQQQQQQIKINKKRVQSTNHREVAVQYSPIATKKEQPSIKRSNSCSALPSNIKPLDRHNPRIEHDKPSDNQNFENRSTRTDIEEKENAILRQCYRNEGLSPECADMGCNYLNCSHDTPMSRFPLPDHLNYPLNKYYKSETNLHRLQPLKKIRTSLRKLKNKTQNIHLSTPDRYNNYSFSTSIDNSVLSTDNAYLDSSITDFESNDAILARLGRTPNSKRTWVKKLFKWNAGKNKKSPKKKGDNVIYSGPRTDPSLKKRSLSTRSIPEALMNIWSKVSEPAPATKTATHEFEFTMATTLTRAASMPSISNHRVAKQQSTTDVIYFNEKGPKENEDQYVLKKFFEPIERPSLPSPQKGGCDVITGLLGQTPNHREEFCAVENNNRISSRRSSDFSAQYYMSCQDVRSQYSVPPSHHQLPPPHGHCQCCMHVHAQYGNFTSNQYVPPFHAPHYIPEHHVAPTIEQFYQKYDDCDDALVQPIAYYTKSDLSVAQPTPKVVAPLDMKISVERRAERRKISEMVFDTFV